MAIVITVSGKAEAGKDFSSIIIKEKLEEMGKKVLIIHYADYLKFIASKYFGWNGEKDTEGRRLLQWLGTDVVRARMPDFWVGVVVLFLKVFSIDYDYILIPDTRFPNEIKLLKHDFDVITVKVERLNYTSTLSKEAQNHPSEKALDNHSFDYVLASKSGRANVEREVLALISNIQRRTITSGHEGKFYEQPQIIENSQANFEQEVLITN